MGKIKIYELAKKLGVENNALLEIVKKNQITATSHLSAITEDEAMKIENIVKGEKNIKSMENKKDIKKEIKKEEPVIIRRAVIISDEEIERRNEEERKKKEQNRSKNVGFVDGNRKKDYNIVYRDKPSKPLTVNELFGLTKKESKPKVEEKTEIKEEVKEEIKKEENIVEKNENKTIEKKENNNETVVKTEKKNFVNNKQSDYQNNDKRQQRPNNNRPNNYNNGKPNFSKNNDRNNNGGFKKSMDERTVDKKIKNIMEIDIPEKENVREYSNKLREKQKIFKLTEITIPESINVKDLAAEMKITSGDVIKKLLSYGIMATINNQIDFDTAFLIAQEYGITAIKKNIVTDEDRLIDESEDLEEDLQARPPVIVVMGHVDHGKTSLLDAIRKTNVIEGESGGITQHIGAYQVKINDRDITFLDTPGHEAFTSMRARGAQITDIAILVVAANDGVMPQTVEAINHAKAAEIPIIVAVNKMDLPDANFEKVQQELMKYELVPEAWGGNTIYVPISAKKGDGIEELLEMVLLQADMLELKANPKKQAKGTIIEARLDKNRGPVATMLVQRGKLDLGDTIIVGSTIGRIRSMTNDKGKTVKTAGPSTPVEITGLHSVPQSGDIFYEVKDEKTAKHLIEKRQREQREKALSTNNVVTLDDLFNKIESENLKQLNLIVKADVQGSVEALKQSLEKLSNSEVRVKVIHSNVGGVTESDVTLAKVSQAIIIAFNVRAEVIAKTVADSEGVEIKTYSIIYDAINDVEAAMKGMLDPVFKEVIIGNAEVRQTFKISNVGTIAGAYVLDGKLSRNAGIRVIRDNIVLHDGKLVSLKRFKDDVKEVNHGYECGLQIENYNDLQEGDTLEVYIMEQVKQ